MLYDEDNICTGLELIMNCDRWWWWYYKVDEDYIYYPSLTFVDSDNVYYLLSLVVLRQ